MATPAQIAANQRNAQLSTGPKSEEGKARSAMNALKSGLDAQSLIIPGESPEAFAQLKDEYYSKYAPTDPEQRFYLDTALRHDWLLRRLQKTEEQLWALASSRIQSPKPHLELGQSWDNENTVMMRLHRRMVYSEKAYERAMAAFHRLQAQENKEDNPKLASFRTASPKPPVEVVAMTPRPQTAGWTGNEPKAWRL